MSRIALERLRPDGLQVEQPPEIRPGRQVLKSAQTRRQILDATLSCLAQEGYDGCSLPAVARRAGVSRGAMTHHYSNKRDLMAAVIEFVFYRRMEMFVSRIRELTEQERQVENRGIRIAYEISLTPEYRALLALHIASLNDEDLRPLFAERARLFETVWQEEIVSAFPEWDGDPRFEMLDDFVWVVIGGLALNRPIWAETGRADAILDFVAKTITDLHQRTIDQNA